MEREPKVEKQTERDTARGRDSSVQSTATAQPLMLLQQQAGNQAVSALIGGQLAVTESGRTTFHPQALTHRRFPEIAAHEAVHRAQFQASGKPTGTVQELEHDAVAGTRTLLAGRPHDPRFRAPAGAALASPILLDDRQTTIEDNVASLEHLGTGASKTGTLNADVQREGSFGTKQRTTYHLQVKGQGSRGSIDSQTDLILVIEPKDPLLTGPAKDPELHIVHTTEPATAYPVMLFYLRTLEMTDAAGRKCTVKVQGKVYLTREQYSGGMIDPPTSFDSLLHLKGDFALMSVTLTGSSLVQKYNAQADAGGEADLSTISRTIAKYLELPRGAPNPLSKEEARFVEPGMTAGDQFKYLEAFLESADTEEMGRRVMEDLNRLSARKMPPSRKKDDDDDDDDSGGGFGDLPGWLKGALIGLVVGLAIVGAIFVVAAAFGVSLAVAAAAVGATIAATMLVYALKSRFEEADAAGIHNPLSIICAAILDTIGVSDIWQAITDKSILTGHDLNRTMGERIAGGFVGVVQTVFTFLGIGEMSKRGVFTLDDPDVPALQPSPDSPAVPSPDITPTPDPVPAPPPSSPAPTPAQTPTPPKVSPPPDPPGTMRPATPAEPGKAPTVYRRKPGIKGKNEPDIQITDETEEPHGTGGRDYDTVPHDPDEIKTGFTETDAPDRFHWSMTEEDLREYGVREFRGRLPAEGWVPQPRYANRQPVQGIVRRDPAFPNRPASTQPDWFHPGDGSHPPVSLEGKNWKIKTGGDIDEFVTKTANQARTRDFHLPSGSQQYLVIDIRGQDVPAAVRQQVIDRLVRESGGVLQPNRIFFLDS